MILLPAERRALHCAQNNFGGMSPGGDNGHMGDMAGSEDSWAASSIGGCMGVTSFVRKLYEMVTREDDSVVGFISDGTAFEVKDQRRLETDVLPKYFRHSRFQSLVRQLNFYNFRKISKERSVWIYKHALFRRDEPELLYALKRKTNQQGDKPTRAPRPFSGSRGHRAHATAHNQAQLKAHIQEQQANRADMAHNSSTWTSSVFTGDEHGTAAHSGPEEAHGWADNLHAFPPANSGRGAKRERMSLSILCQAAESDGETTASSGGSPAHADHCIDIGEDAMPDGSCCKNKRRCRMPNPMHALQLPRGGAGREDRWTQDRHNCLRASGGGGGGGGGPAIRLAEFHHSSRASTPCLNSLDSDGGATTSLSDGDDDEDEDCSLGPRGGAGFWAGRSRRPTAPRGWQRPSWDWSGAVAALDCERRGGRRHGQWCDSAEQQHQQPQGEEREEADEGEKEEEEGAALGEGCTAAGLEGVGAEGDGGAGEEGEEAEAEGGGEGAAGGGEESRDADVQAEEAGLGGLRVVLESLSRPGSRTAQAVAVFCCQVRPGAASSVPTLTVQVAEFVGSHPGVARDLRVYLEALDPSCTLKDLLPDLTADTGADKCGRGGANPRAGMVLLRAFAKFVVGLLEKAADTCRAAAGLEGGGAGAGAGAGGGGERALRIQRTLQDALGAWWRAAVRYS